jgi:hypothetical protein
MEEIKLNRKELYDLVWSEPLSRLAKKYNLTDNGIRKRCKKMNIPLPKAGHWAKIRHGYKVPKPKLPGNYNGETETILCYRNKDGKYVENIETASPFKVRKAEIINNKELPLKVPQRLTNPDKLIIDAKEYFKNQDSSSGRYPGVLESWGKVINIRVAPKNLPRALRIMDTFIKLIKARKHTIELKYGKTILTMYEIEFEVSLKEKFRINKNAQSWYDQRYLPTGVLAIRKDYIYDKEWRDGKILLEEQLPKILTKLELEAQERKARRDYNREQNRIREEKERIRKELLQRKQNEISRFKALLNHAIYWKQTETLRQYIESLETEKNLDDERKEWLSWAKQKLNWFDPFVKGSDELLNDSDREKLIQELYESKNNME